MKEIYSNGLPLSSWDFCLLSLFQYLYLSSSCRVTFCKLPEIQKLCSLQKVYRFFLSFSSISKQVQDSALYLSDLGGKSTSWPRGRAMH